MSVYVYKNVNSLSCKSGLLTYFHIETPAVNSGTSASSLVNKGYKDKCLILSDELSFRDIFYVALYYFTASVMIPSQPSTNSFVLSNFEKIAVSETGIGGHILYIPARSVSLIS